MANEWRPVPGYEGLYEVSDTGVVVGLPRTVPRISRNENMGTRRYAGGVKTLYFCADGYVQVSLCKLGHQKAYRVSRLVLAAFEGPPSAGAEACHLNHDRADNRASNLSWGSRQENEDAKSESGRRPRNTINKLTEADVANAKKLRAEGMTYKAIGGILGCHLSNIHMIVKGKTWQLT